MLKKIYPGSKVQISKDILVGGEVAFYKDEAVVIEKIKSVKGVGDFNWVPVYSYGDDLRMTRRKTVSQSPLPLHTILSNERRLCARRDS